MNRIFNGDSDDGRCTADGDPKTPMIQSRRFLFPLAGRTREPAGDVHAIVIGFVPACVAPSELLPDFMHVR